MKPISLAATAAVMLATIASAQAQNPQTPSQDQITSAPVVVPNPAPNRAESRPLFTIGNFEVHLWSPVEPPYDANDNRNQAANPVWGD
jgi:hypothetical protein